MNNSTYRWTDSQWCTHTLRDLVLNLNKSTPATSFANLFLVMKKCPSPLLQDLRKSFNDATFSSKMTTITAVLHDDSGSRIDNADNVDAVAALCALDDLLCEVPAFSVPRLVPTNYGDCLWLIRRALPLSAYMLDRNVVPYCCLRNYILLPKTVGNHNIKIIPRTLPDELVQTMRKTVKEGVRVFIATFNDDVHLDVTDNAGRFIINGIKRSHTETRRQSVRYLLEKARNQHADILIFPELTIDQDLRDELEQDLANGNYNFFKILVPGSFHMRDESGSQYNESVILSNTGERLSTHRKFNLYMDHGDKRTESVCAGETFEILVTPIGLVAMAICSDFCDTYVEMWNDPLADWILVPAFGNNSTLNAHRDRARYMRYRGCVSVVAQQMLKEPQWWVQGEGCGFICLEQDPGFELAMGMGSDTFVVPPPR